MEKEKNLPKKGNTDSLNETRHLKETLDDMHFDEAKRITEVLIGEKGIKIARSALEKLGYKNLGKKGYTPELRAIFQAWQMSEYGKSHPEILDIGYDSKNAAYGVIGANGLNLLKSISDARYQKKINKESISAETKQNLHLLQEYSQSIRHETELDGTKYISTREFMYTADAGDLQLFRSYFPKYKGEPIKVLAFRPKYFKKLSNSPFGFYQNDKVIWIREDLLKDPQELKNTIRNETWHYLFDAYKLGDKMNSQMKGVKRVSLARVPKEYATCLYNPAENHLELDQFGSDVFSVMNETYDEFLRDMETNVTLSNSAAKKKKRSEYALSGRLMYAAYLQAESTYGENGSSERKIKLVRQVLRKYLDGIIFGGNDEIKYSK